MTMRGARPSTLQRRKNAEYICAAAVFGRSRVRVRDGTRALFASPRCARGHASTARGERTRRRRRKLHRGNFPASRRRRTDAGAKSRARILAGGGGLRREGEGMRQAYAVAYRAPAHALRVLRLRQDAGAGGPSPAAAKCSAGGALLWRGPGVVLKELIRLQSRRGHDHTARGHDGA